ncbi:MAG: Circadian clock protein kinase KaiC [Candidatus Thorarchaeota archaeon]|nr:MAG: Circadian clock protein kinase KaiC [Candidatus Thorarchaeota archaeon]
MNRTPTGIHGLDDLVNGGFIEGSTILLSGCSGSGKTVFGLQFLYRGAVDFDEAGVFVTLESRPNEIRQEALQFGWNLEDIEKEKKLIIIDASSSKAGLPTSESYTLRRGFDVSALAEEIYRAIHDIGAKRLVIDSLSGIGIRFDQPVEVRNAVFTISALLRELNVTSLFVSEILHKESLSLAGVEQYTAQCLISLDLIPTNNSLERGLTIWKMRGSAHSLKRHKLTIDDKGIKVS